MPASSGRVHIRVPTAMPVAYSDEVPLRPLKSDPFEWRNSAPRQAITPESIEMVTSAGEGALEKAAENKRTVAHVLVSE